MIDGVKAGNATPCPPSFVLTYGLLVVEKGMPRMTQYTSVPISMMEMSKWT